MSFWALACSASDKPKESTFEALNSRLTQKQKLADGVYIFDVPTNLKFGSFDSLIKLVDDLTKFDSQVESVVRRVERQALDLDSALDLKIVFQRAEVSVEEYVTRFKWDDIKFPRGRCVQDNMHLLLSGMQKVDEEVKSKSQQYSDAKQQASSLAKKDQVTHVQRDLVDILTPATVSDSDFVYTEHLTTLVLVIPRGSDIEFVNQYASFDEFVVPESAQRIAADDKEGNSLWRVVLFKSAVEGFKTHCRQHRFTVRDFTYEPHRFKEVLEARSASESELKRHESILRKVCQVAFSDAMIAWIHVKAIRIFVESVLRFGVPPNFGAYLVKPNSSKIGKLRTELLDVLGNANGLSSMATNGDSGATEEEGEYFPYVSLSFTPLSSR